MKTNKIFTPNLIKKNSSKFVNVKTKNIRLYGNITSILKLGQALWLQSI